MRLERRPYRFGDGPHESGIYFLFAGFELLYVGQSVSIASRLRSHAIRFNMYATICLPRHWLDKVEHHYIVAHQPPLNTRGVSEDIQRARRIARGLAWAAGVHRP